MIVKRLKLTFHAIETYILKKQMIKADGSSLNPFKYNRIKCKAKIFRRSDKVIKNKINDIAAKKSFEEK